MGGSTIRTSEQQVARFQLQRSAYGAPIPMLYGTQLTSGNLVQLEDFKAIAHTQKQRSGKGGGVTQENTTYTYQAAYVIALCEGPISAIKRVLKDNVEYEAAAVETTLAELGLEVAFGALGQAEWGYAATKHPTRSLGYSGVALVRGAGRELSKEGALQNLSFEVVGPCLGHNGKDADPALMLVDYLSNPRSGVGFASSLVGNLSTFATYCRAQGLQFSPLLDTQASAAETLTTLFKLCNCAPVWSEGQLKVVPFGDTALSANGATYTPTLTPIFDLTDDDFLREGDEAPLRMTRKTSADAYNHVQLEWRNRSKRYAAELSEAKDQASIERDGLRTRDKIDAHWICEPDVATAVAHLLLQRDLYTRNEYEFRLGWRHALLEPMDLVTLTDAGLGLDKTPVRIVSVDEDEEGGLTLVAEDFPLGAGHPPLYVSQVNQSTSPNADPGDVTLPVVLEAPPELTSTGLALRVAVTGSAALWGGADIWLSLDNASYQLYARLSGGARYGSLVQAITASATTARVQLVGQGGELAGASAQDASLLKSLIWIEGEYMAYQTATLVAANTYDLGGLVRGAYGTAAVSHNANERFVRVDDSTIAGPDLSLDHLGKAVYLKFASFNALGGATQPLDAVVPYQYSISGALLNLPPPKPTGLNFLQQPDGVNVSWTRPSYRRRLRTEVWRSTSVNGVYGLATTVDGDNYVDNSPGGSTRFYKVRSIDQFGVVGEYTGVVSAASKTVEDGADSSLRHTPSMVLNPEFEAGDIHWGKDAGWVIQKSPSAYRGEWCAIFTGSTAAITAEKPLPIAAGDVVSWACWVASSANADGVLRARLQSYNSSGARTTFASSEIGPGTAYRQVRALGTVPFDAALVQVDVAVFSRTAGAWFVDSTMASVLSRNQDEVPDGPTFGRTANDVLTDNRPDFAKPLRNRTLDHISSTGLWRKTRPRRVDDSGDPYVDFGEGINLNRRADFIEESASRRWAAETGANVTEARTSLDASNLGGRPAPTVRDESRGGFELTVPGSGRRLGSQRNALPITIANQRSKFTGLNISSSFDASSPAVVTISASAFTLLLGGEQASYNASSVAVSQPRGTTRTYYLYFDDPQLSGGAQTLLQTTDGNQVYGSKDRVWLGSITVTVPASGGGTGSGGTGGGGGSGGGGAFP